MDLKTWCSQERGRAVLLGEQIGVPSAFVSQMVNGKRAVPPAQVRAIRAATNGEVREWDLRPDDWHRIWPELINVPGAPAVPEKAEA